MIIQLYKLIKTKKFLYQAKLENYVFLSKYDARIYFHFNYLKFKKYLPKYYFIIVNLNLFFFQKCFQFVKEKNLKNNSFTELLFFFYFEKRMLILQIVFYLYPPL